MQNHFPCLLPSLLWRICWVLNDHRKPDLDRFVGQVEQDVAELFGVANVPVQGGVWRINDDAFKRASAYAGIITANYKGEASTDEPEEADA